MSSVFEVRDEVWEAVEPLLPTVEPARTGRPRVADRVAFNAIFYVLITGIAWRSVPQELGCSGVTAWRRLRDWQAAGVWEQLHATLLERLNAAGAIDWSAAVVDGSHIRALQRGPGRRGLRLVDLAKRTYHGDTFASGYYAPLRAIFGGTPAANANCSGTFDGRVNDALRKAGTKLGEGDIGVEQPGH